MLDAQNSCCAADQAGISRRRLLTGSLAAGAVIALHQNISIRPARADSLADTLIVLSLRGGFDGLSAIAPVGDPNYYAARPQLAVPAALALQLDQRFGLHPALAPLLPWWENKKFAVVHAAGLPTANRSHFSAMAEMERAAPGSALRTGWLNRTLGLREPAEFQPFRGVSLGLRPPQATAGPQPFLGLRTINSYRLETATETPERLRWARALEQLNQQSGPHLRDTARTAMQTLAAVAEFEAGPLLPQLDYPSNTLGQNLRDAAQLVQSGQPISVITIDDGDWDMHVGMGTATQGWMHRNLSELGRALAAFATDLGDQLDRVCLVTISEFGRRVQQNDSGGLDHGWGNAMLLLGGGVVGGQVHGQWPGLAAAKLANGDLAVTTDYRAVLAEILSNRCGASPAQAREVFPGLAADFPGVTAARQSDPGISDPPELSAPPAAG